MPTATADMATETGLAERLVETAKVFRLGYRPELLCEPQRAARGGLGIEKPTRYHAVEEPSLGPWLTLVRTLIRLEIGRVCALRKPHSWGGVPPTSSPVREMGLLGWYVA